MNLKRYHAIRELLEAADKMGEKLQIFEGFIGTSNSQLLIMIIPIVFVGIMGDFPRVDGNAMFYIHRVGRLYNNLNPATATGHILGLMQCWRYILMKYIRNRF